jgi:hypothetical protein
VKKSILDQSFSHISRSQTDLEKTFERMWRELGEREEAEASSGSAYSKVRLQCNDEVVDIGAVVLLGLRGSALGAESIAFVCPRCGRRHESPRLR